LSYCNECLAKVLQHTCALRNALLRFSAPRWAGGRPRAGRHHGCV